MFFPHFGRQSKRSRQSTGIIFNYIREHTLSVLSCYLGRTNCPELKELRDYFSCVGYFSVKCDPKIVLYGEFMIVGKNGQLLVDVLQANVKAL